MESRFMPYMSLKAHFDGTEVVFDEPVNLEPDTKLLVTVLPNGDDIDRDNWLRLSLTGLGSAYSEDEPEYMVKHLIKANPEYDRR